MERKIKSCQCGSKEFISEPNRYDVYEIIDGKLVLVDSPFIEDEIKIFCRECGEELKDAEEYISD
jgi:hypothetical protein